MATSTTKGGSKSIIVEMVDPIKPMRPKTPNWESPKVSG
jgi:hypothetical protein